MDVQPKPSPPPASSDAEGSPTATGGPESFHRWAHQPEPAPPDPSERPATSALRSIPIFLAEMKAYGRHFISAKIDGLVATGKKIAVYAALGVVGLLVAAGMLFTACFLVLRGLAEILGRLLWHQYWLGELLVGLLVLGGTALGVKIGIGRFTRASRLKTEQKYEGQRIQQRVEFGRDVRQRADEARRSAK
jgi:hypothetical protein